MQLTFLGAAGEVTGSCTLVEAGGLRFLVDCGMFQGGPEARMKNRAPFPFDPRALDFVLLTHAHIDHSGLLPRLVAEGYRGPVHATTATCDLLQVMLMDSAHIQEKEAEWSREARGSRSRRHAPGSGNGSEENEPLYNSVQAMMALKQLRPADYDREVNPADGVSCVFRDAGHILGSAIIECRVAGRDGTRKLVFSGDIGSPARPIVRDPTPIAEADVLIVESTYGNRLHRAMDDTIAELAHAVSDTLERKGGNLIVPAFAVGRTQDLLYLLSDLHRQGRIPALDIYVDSPMAMKATEITLKHTEILDHETAAMITHMRKGGAVPSIHFVQDVEESVALRRIERGAVIISASGMCEAGRIKHHLRNNLPREESTILITGFQAAGTLGRRLVDGAKEVRIFGAPVPVRAQIYTINGLSAHADQAGLLDWLGHFRRAPRAFVVHGEQETADTFAAAIRERLRWTRVEVPRARVPIDIGSEAGA
jgi:metallo-beta-lactamase family protein